MDEAGSFKVSDVIADYLVTHGVAHVFGVTGGASIHLLHSLRVHEGIEPVFVHHEQAAAMAADGYARVSENFGVAVATSGPGATNLITGIAGAWFDSIPVLFITGQVARYRLRGNLRTRQYGFQETDVVQMVSGITKFARQVSSPEEVIPTLDLAVGLMRAGRPGPVLVDIPDDIQRAFIQAPIPLDRYSETSVVSGALEQQALTVLRMLQASQRPVLVIGAGLVATKRGRELATTLIQQSKIPTLTTWRAKDLAQADSVSVVGTFGTHGTRAGNFIVQNSDFTLVLGSRLSTRETGTPMALWARGSNVVVVDIDSGELEKFEALGRGISLGITADCKDFTGALLDALTSCGLVTPLPGWEAWMSYVKRVQLDYDPIKVGERSCREGYVDPYRLMRILAQEVPKGEHIFLDTGCTVAWAMQAFAPQREVRLHHDCNNTAMGWALPAALGGALAGDVHQATCLVGDGSIMMNLQELASLISSGSDVVTILLNNQGYGMVRQTEEQWLESRYVGTDSKSGDLSFPDFSVVASAFGLPYIRLDSEDDVQNVLREAYLRRRCLVEVMISPVARVIPQSRFGYPIEDGEPTLDRAEFAHNMLIEPYDPSEKL